MGLFRNNNFQVLPQKSQLELKYNTARMNLLMMIIFTAVNILFISLGSATYFLFSAAIPYYFVSLGAVMCGRMPAEYYEDAEAFEFMNPTFYWIMVVLAVVLILIYLLCWVASKKSSGWLVGATVLFGIDTLGMFYLYGFNIEMIVDILFHIWVLIYLIIGLVAHNKLKNLPEEEPVDKTEMQNTTDEGFAANTDVNEQNPNPTAQEKPNSYIIREAAKDVKHRVLLEVHALDYDICYRRVKHTNELVINGNVYDEIQGVMEYPHTLKAWVDGHYIAAIYNGTHSIISVDGENVAKKLRVF